MALSTPHFTVIEPKEIASMLHRSLSWVYAHAHELGGSYIGGSFIFTLEGLIDAYEAGKDLAGARKGKPKDVHQGRLHNQERRCRVGKSEAEKVSIRERARELGLVVIDR